MILLLLVGCLKGPEIDSIYTSAPPPLNPPHIETIEKPANCPTRTTSQVVDGCAVAIVPAWRVLMDEQQLSLGDWYKNRAELCYDHREIDRAFADEMVNSLQQNSQQLRRTNGALRFSIAAGVAGGMLLGVSSAAIAAWMLGEVSE